MKFLSLTTRRLRKIRHSRKPMRAFVTGALMLVKSSYSEERYEYRSWSGRTLPRGVDEILNRFRSRLVPNLSWAGGEYEKHKTPTAGSFHFRFLPICPARESHPLSIYEHTVRTRTTRRSQPPRRSCQSFFCGFEVW